MLITVSEMFVAEAKRTKDLKDQYQQDINAFLKNLLGLMVNFVTANKKNQVSKRFTIGLEIQESLI